VPEDDQLPAGTEPAGHVGAGPGDGIGRRTERRPRADPPLEFGNCHRARGTHSEGGSRTDGRAVASAYRSSHRASEIDVSSRALTHFRRMSSPVSVTW